MRLHLRSLPHLRLHLRSLLHLRLHLRVLLVPLRYGHILTINFQPSEGYETASQHGNLAICLFTEICFGIDTAKADAGHPFMVGCRTITRPVVTQRIDYIKRLLTLDIKIYVNLLYFAILGFAFKNSGFDGHIGIPIFRMHHLNLI